MLYARSHGRLNAAHASDTVSRAWLADSAGTPGDILTASYAEVIGACCDPHSPPFVPALGLDMPLFRGLLSTCFPRFIAPEVWLSAQRKTAGDEGPLAEFHDLLQLLLDHRAINDNHHRCIAHLVAAACMRSNHLWQDMGLPDRQALSRILILHFPALALKNIHDMKWKKFFYRQLCEREGLKSCNRPSCETCCDYHSCFGAED